MARTLGKLTALGVARASEPGMYADGGGLYLQVTGAGAKSWIFRYSLNGRAREMGLGSLTAITLADARAKAGQCRRLRQEGIDPIEARKADRITAAVEAAKAITFKECAEKYIEAHRASWSNGKHAQQWTNTLATYAYPHFGSLPVPVIDTGLVLKAIEPIWSKKTETAARVRARIEAVLDFAKVRGYRQGENPARWRGHLDLTLPRRSRVRRVEHHAALPYSELPEFMGKLRAEKGTAARALEFLILTAARTGEVLGAGPKEIDSAEKAWTVPAERMKAGVEHRVPLSPAAFALVKGQDGEFLFAGRKKGKELSNMSMLVLLDRMGYDVTVHGFRSTFRDWAAETTNYPREVAEAALAHTIDSKVEAAYRRGDLFEKRRQIMNAWAKYCASEPRTGKVIPIRKGADSQ
jgi:integrase